MVIIGPSVGILCPRDIWIHNKLHARIRSLCTYLSFRHIHKQNPTLRNIQAYICIYIGVERLEHSNQSHKQNNPLPRHIHMHMCGNSHITYIYKYIHTHIHKHIHACMVIGRFNSIKVPRNYFQSLTWNNADSNVECKSPLLHSPVAHPTIPN
mgnify:CR=1 FL=1